MIVRILPHFMHISYIKRSAACLHSSALVLILLGKCGYHSYYYPYPCPSANDTGNYKISNLEIGDDWKRSDKSA